MLRDRLDHAQVRTARQAQRLLAAAREHQRALGVDAFGGQLVGPLGLEHDRGAADRDAEAAEAARAVARGRQHAQMQARRRLDTHRSRGPSGSRARSSRRLDIVHRRALPRPRGLVDEHLQPVQLGADLRSREQMRAGGEDRRLEHRVAGAIEAEELAPSPPPTTTVLTTARCAPSSIASTRTSRHEQASSSTAPATPAAGRVGGCGSSSAAWLKSRMSSVRFTTAAPVARRLRSVRVPRKGLMTIRSSPHSTPIAPQLTVPSGLIVVTTVSMMGARRS